MSPPPERPGRKIGIIGAGYVSRALTAILKRSGHEVMLSNSRGAASLFSVVKSLNVLGGTSSEAAAFGEIVILAAPLSAYGDIPAAPLDGKIVVDAQNYYPERDGRLELLDTNALTTSELVAQHLPRVRLVKAFNAITAADMERDGLPGAVDGRRALPVAGDDAAAKREICALHDALGFDTVDVGTLSESWRCEPGTPIYCVPMDKARLSAALAATRRIDVGARH